MIGYRRRNQIKIVRKAREMKLGHAGAACGIATADVESGFKNYASNNVPVSMRISHDAVGYDHASLGVMQQQTGYHWVPNGYGENMNQTTMDSPDGWGKPADLMNVEHAAKLFYDRLKEFDFRAYGLGAACQRVQGSAYPDRYNQVMPHAEEIVRKRWKRADPEKYKKWRAWKDRQAQKRREQKQTKHHVPRKDK